MNTILSVISGELRNQESRFVFPSEAASSEWALKVCGLTGSRSIALNRFLAWDRFKEGIIRSEVQDREPVSAILRKLFAEDLVRRNAEALRRGNGRADGEKAALPFRALIPPDFAEDGAVFASRMAGLLPSLKLLRLRLEAAGASYTGDDEDRDFMALEREYAAFLETRRLFEPAWERPPLKDREHRYYIFFPEAIEDFAEYEGILTNEPTIRLIRLEKSDPPPFRSFASSRAEIRSLVLEIRGLHETEGVPFEDMAVSVPDLDSMAPYLLRELSLYAIPARRRSGRPLGDYGTGKLFSLAGSCVSNAFSFTAVKSLLLNEGLPWSQPARNKELINFGILNNCVSAYRDQGKQVDIWEAAFRTASREERLRLYYRDLKSVLSAMAGARTFKDIRKHYFDFRGRWEKEAGATGFLSRDACTDEGDAVLARCVEELSALIQIEEKYPDLTPPAPFQFFLGILREKQYVPIQEKAGVNIFPYRVAAASPFTCHFVLNASQDAATVLYQPLKFLRQDKRKRLGLSAEDADVSGSFFRLYRLGPWEGFKPRLRISASVQTFSGWAIPHSVFFESSSPGDISDSTVAAAPSSQDRAEDLFRQEQDWWAAGGDFSSRGAGVLFPSRLFPAQKRGFENWRTLLNLREQEPYSLLRYPFPRNTPAASLLENRISAKQRIPAEMEAGGSLIRVSATTDLNVFFFCPAKWLYQKLFETRTLDLQARLMDDASLGLLYHQILKDLFIRIRGEDRVFKQERLDEYSAWTEEITLAAARNHPAFQGPLAIPLVVSQAKAISRRIKSLFKVEARYFDGYAPADIECSLSLEQNGLLLKGVLDRVSVSPEDGPLIVDYKTGTTPTKAESTGSDDTPLRDFQMPMYVKLYEERTGVPVETACFLSINNLDVTAVIGSPGKKRGHTREAYQETLDVFDGCTRRFAESLETLDFVPLEIDPAACSECEYRCLCRTNFTLNAQPYKRNTKTRNTAAGAENAAEGDMHVR